MNKQQVFDAEPMTTVGDLLDAFDAHRDTEANSAAKSILRTNSKPKPASLDMERAILSAVLVDDSCLVEIEAEGLKASDFYRPNHATIFGVMVDLRQRGERIGLLTVVDELHRLGKIDEVGGAAAVGALGQLVYGTAFAAPYAKAVRDMAERRELITVAEDAVAHAISGRLKTDEIATYTEQQIERIRTARPRVDSFGAAVDTATRELREALREGQTTAAPGPAFKAAGDILFMDIPRVDWLVNGVLTKNSIGFLAAEPKAFKTWAALELLLSVSTGTRAFDEFATGEPREVAAFLTEDDLASFKNRMVALAVGRGMTPEKALSRMHYACLETLDLRQTEQAAWLVASIRALPSLPAVVLLDPFRNVIGDTEEDSASQMAPILEMCRAIRSVAKTTILIVHHAGKSSDNSKKRRGGQNMRGSSAIHGAVDCGMYLSETRASSNRWTNHVEVETKRARGAGTFGLELQVEDDEHGAAQKAVWLFHRSTSTLPVIGELSGNSGELPEASTKEKVRALLQQEYETDQAAGEDQRGWGAPAVSKRLAIPERSVLRALGDLETDGCIVRVGRIWLYRPEELQQQELGPYEKQ